MKIELKIEIWLKQNRDFDLEVILGKVVILISILEIKPVLLVIGTHAAAD